MKISELIEHLEKLKSEHGECRVFFYGAGAYNHLEDDDCTYEYNTEDWRHSIDLYPAPGVYIG